MPSTSVGRSNNVNTCICIRVTGEACTNQQHLLLHTSPVSALLQMASVMHLRSGLSPLRSALQRCHRCLRAWVCPWCTSWCDQDRVDGLIADCLTRCIGAKWKCHATMYGLCTGHSMSASWEDLPIKTTAAVPAAFHRVSTEFSTSSCMWACMAFT